MKANVLTSPIKNLILKIPALVLVFTFNACVTKSAFLTSSAVPAARGDVKVKKDNNRNYVIKIKLTNLAEVKRLEPSMQAYVVWMESDGALIKNLGQINSSSNMLSKKLKASFETVSSSRPTKIFITAESEANVMNPGSMIILSTSDF
ncbi:MAG: hypothetical protein IPP96_14250 [Chitinophagaceae bacterium]|nr:hypothetical protein [Chitinophagaceae bacterium]